MNLSDSCLYTEEELLDILHDREEDIINVIRMNYDNLINKREKITRIWKYFQSSN